MVPKYEREALNARVVQSTQDGVNAEAIARGESGKSQALGALSQQHQRRTEVNKGNLLQRLGEFDSYLNNIMVQDATSRAKKAGVIDTAKRRAEIMEIRVKYAGDEQRIKEEIAKVTTATMEDNFSVYGAVYTNTRDATYANQVEIDAQNADYMAQKISDGDPEKYKKAYKAYENELVQEAPNTLGMITAHKAFEKRGTGTYVQLYKNQQSSNATNFKQLQTGSIEALQHLIDDASSKGDEATVASLQGQLLAQTKSAVENGTMSPAEAKWITDKTFNKVQMGEFVRAINTNVDNGNGHDMLGKMLTPNHPYGKLFNKLNTETQEELLKIAKTRIEAYEDGINGKAEAENKHVKIMSEQNLRDTKQFMLEDGRKISNSKINEMEANGELTSKDARNLKEFANQTTDDELLVHLEPYKNLLALTTEDIMGLDGLSTDDRRKLLSRHDTLTKQYQWTSTQNGREAIRRINGLFGIVPESMFKGFGNDKNAENHEKMRTDLYDKLAGVPVEQQSEKALVFANELIADYHTNVSEVEKEAIQIRADKNLLDEAEEKLNKYNKNTFWFDNNRTMRQQLSIMNKEPAEIDRIMEHYKPDGEEVKKEVKPTKPKKKKPLAPLTDFTPNSTNYKGTRPSVNYKTNSHSGSKLPVVAQGTTNRYTGRVGGSKSWRNNNPFNITGASGYKPKGAVGVAQSNYGDIGDQTMLVFETYADGQQAFIDLVYRSYNDAPIETSFNKYQTDKVSFAGKLRALRQVGVPTNVRFGDLSASQQIDFMKVWRRFEGYKVGRSL